VVESTLEELDTVVNAFRVHSPSALELVDKSVFRMMGRWERVSKYSRTEDPYLVFCEFDGDSGDSTPKAEEVAGSKAGEYDPIALTSQADISEAWDTRSETLTLAQEIRKGARLLAPGVEDLVVPAGRLADLVKLLADEFGRRGLEYISYGHAGDANLHARPLIDVSDSVGRKLLEDLMVECFEAVWKMGGSMTGEHGDGMLRAKYVEGQYPKSYWIMRELKDIFDPGWVLNPGVKIAKPASP
jgi:FAD/FMN-containing dehydrogenase